MCVRITTKVHKAWSRIEEAVSGETGNFWCGRFCHKVVSVSPGLRLWPQGMREGVCLCELVVSRLPCNETTFSTCYSRESLQLHVDFVNCKTTYFRPTHLQNTPEFARWSHLGMFELALGCRQQSAAMYPNRTATYLVFKLAILYSVGVSCIWLQMLKLYSQLSGVRLL